MARWWNPFVAMEYFYICTRKEHLHRWF